VVVVVVTDLLVDRLDHTEMEVLAAVAVAVAVLQIRIMVLPSQIHHNHSSPVSQLLKEEI
jgi:hypothetical protein